MKRTTQTDLADSKKLKKSKKMKYEVTFAEVGQIFSMVGKIESAVESFKEAEALSDNLSIQFDSEFAKYNYTFFNAPAELHQLFDAKCSAWDDKEKKFKAIRASIRKFIEMTGIKNGCRECWEDEILQFACKPYSFELNRVLYDVKLAAKNIAKYIKF